MSRSQAASELRMVLAAIIFLAVMVDAVRSARFARLRRRMLRPD